MGKPTILCVDDEAIILLALKQELRLHFQDRYVITTALSAEQAKHIMSTLQEEKRDVSLIICDWLMPGMKGDVFLSEVKEKNPSCKLLVITGHADQEALATFQNKVGAKIIYKPWKSEELINTISELLGQ